MSTTRQMTYLQALGFAFLLSPDNSEAENTLRALLEAHSVDAGLDDGDFYALLEKLSEELRDAGSLPSATEES